MKQWQKGKFIIMKISKEKYRNLTNQCKKQHKLRENEFGVVWCIRCGLLSTSIGNANKLEKHEILEIHE